MPPFVSDCLRPANPSSARKRRLIRVLDPKRYCTLVSVFTRQCPSVTLNLPTRRARHRLGTSRPRGSLLSLVAPACKRFPIRTLDSKRYCTLVSVFARQRPSVSLPDPGATATSGKRVRRSRARDPPSNPFSTPMAVSNPFSTPVSFSAPSASSVNPNPPAGHARS